MASNKKMLTYEEENMVHNQESNQSNETDPEMIVMIKLIGKSIKRAILSVAYTKRFQW